MLKKDLEHVDFLHELYSYQQRRGLYYLHVSLRNSVSSQIHGMRQLENRSEVHKVINDMKVALTNCDGVAFALREEGG